MKQGKARVETLGTLTITDLCERFNVTPRTIYYYMSIGLLPPAGARGRKANYTEDFAKKLEEVLKFRGKFKLSALKNGDVKKYDAHAEYDRTIVVIHMSSNSSAFLQYAHDAIGTKALMYNIELNSMVAVESMKAMLVLFPVSENAMSEIKSALNGISAYAAEKSQEIVFTASVNSKPFSVTITEKNDV